MQTDEIETVMAGEVMEGDRLPDGQGTVIMRLNDSGSLTYETDTGSVFTKDMREQMQRFVRDAGGAYGIEWELAAANAHLDERLSSAA